MKKSVYFYTYGCQMNVHDSEKMLGILAENGYDTADKPEDADLIVFNTCAIREKAEQKFFSQLGRTKRLKKKREDLNIAVAGCIAQESKGQLMKKYPYVDFILGPQNVHAIHDMVSGKTGRTSVEENHELATMTFSAERQSKIKAWVSIMYGCNNYCSYCIVPYTRGREVSRPSTSIVSEVAALKAKGFRDVTLLGQNVNSYRSDLDFSGLLRVIDRVGLPRIRFVTSHPRDLSDALIQCVAELPSVCEHIHLPLQSGSDRILRQMNRGYTYSDYKRKVEKLREAVPGLALTTDIIAGFPGETDDDFKSTVSALREIGYDGIFAFKYSPRRGTAAFTMEDEVDETVKSDRLNEILKIQSDITFRNNIRLEGTTQEILIEGVSETDDDKLTGRTRTNKIVNIPFDPSITGGSIISVMISRARMHSLDAAPVSCTAR